MTREQVIEGLESVRARLLEHERDTLGAMWIDDALALLKEQEPKQVIKQTYHILVEGGYENPVVVTGYDLLCPTCKSLLCRGVDVPDDNYHYCKVCGQAVKWDEPPKEGDSE